MVETICQSCSMPLNGEEVLGTEKDGSKTKEYCMYCYEGGEFKQPDLTMEGMIEICVPHMKAEGMSEEQARAILNEHLPKLKRWNKQ
ncbi:zinc ribbon domain-containing protein [Effusibacillus lacus]|uniref:Transcriptional regulator n=1 Tax=Effusibacillus lacus TaxID=1348429 RepID=A0A292YIE5_9BACL|nr:zinc ribbon domain-containing protein [Effusibacillus lacus]TCS74176.1 putative zinc ribbon protein [Effusibacillus lacus]GAX90827.1 transcriptional regulator [Effusibacillus lacus]